MKETPLKDIQRKFNHLTRTYDRRLFTRIEALIDKLMPGVPSYSIEYGKATIAILKLDSSLREDEKRWLALARGIDGLLHARGYRSKGDIITMQEHKLIGSSHDGVRDDGTARMRYTPFGVLAGKLSIEEVRRARELSAVIDNYPFDMYFVTGNAGAHAMRGMISLEPLGGNGMTMRDPRPLDREKFEDGFLSGKPLADVFRIAEMPMEKTLDFPFARGESLLDCDAPPKIVREL